MLHLDKVESFWNLDVTVIENGDSNNNDGNDIDECKDNPKTKHEENRYSIISNTFQLLLLISYKDQTYIVDPSPFILHIF